MNIILTKRTRPLIVALGSIALALSIFATATFASLTDNFFGYAWSANVGWIKMNNCASPSDCTGPVNDPSGTYGFGVKVAPTGAMRALTGYAWSSNIGWITFNTAPYTVYNPTTDGATMLDHCPPSGDTDPGESCGAYVLWGTNGGSAVPLKGWARACSVYISGCSGTIKPSYSTGAWDGWISLGDDNINDGAVYGVTMNTASGVLTGYAWGSAVVGWINLSDVKVQDPAMCPDGSVPPTPGDIGSCAVCLGSNPPASCPVVVCPWDGVPVGGVCPNTHTCPDGSTLPTSQICPDTVCPDSSPVPPSGICPGPATNCPDGSMPVGGVCPSTHQCPDGSTIPVGQSCPASCTDGIQNQNETGVDIGGVCGNPNTGTCTDGIQNQNETGVDTGGVCGTGGPSQCTNIPDDPNTADDGIVISFPPYQQLADGRCVCAAAGYILNAHYQCVKPVYTEH